MLHSTDSDCLIRKKTRIAARKELYAIVVVAILAISLGKAQHAASQPASQLVPQPTSPPASMPALNSSELAVELVTEKLKFPTSMTFIGSGGDILVTQKGGEALLLSNASEPKTLMDFTVSSLNERGLLGVAVMYNVSNIEEQTNSATAMDGSNKTSTFVFFYLTEVSKDNKTDVLGNRVYRFEWDNADRSLSNGTLILDLPAEPGLRHNGGKLVADSKSGYLYAVIGDVNRNGTLQNFGNSSSPDNTSVILRVNPDGSPARDNPFFNTSTSNSSYANLSKYYAYGIRNSFGMDFDPVTNSLWITENGPARFDEINVVQPGFNSGWKKVFGPIEKRNTTTSDLTHLPGSHYADPVFAWAKPVAVTDIEFFKSAKFGENYTNNIFAGDFNNGHLYFFTVNETRDGLKFNLTGLANDLIASTPKQVSAVISGTGFAGGITDISTGPDGYLYVLTFGGKMYRIVPK